MKEKYRQIFLSLKNFLLKTTAKKKKEKSQRLHYINIKIFCASDNIKTNLKANKKLENNVQ